MLMEYLGDVDNSGCDLYGGWPNRNRLARHREGGYMIGFVDIDLRSLYILGSVKTGGL